MLALFTGILMRLGFFQGVLMCVGGGMLGVTFYLYLWDALRSAWRNWVGASRPARKPRKEPGLKQRLVDKARANFGLAGIAVLTPLFLTVPVGTLAALALTQNKKRIMVYMFAAFAGWSILFFGLSLLFTEQLDRLAEEFVH